MTDGYNYIVTNAMLIIPKLGFSNTLSSSSEIDYIKEQITAINSKGTELMKLSKSLQFNRSKEFVKYTIDICDIFELIGEEDRPN